MIRKLTNGRLACGAHPKWRGKTEDEAWAHLKGHHPGLVEALSRAELVPVPVDKPAKPEPEPQLFQLPPTRPRARRGRGGRSTKS